MSNNILIIGYPLVFLLVLFRILTPVQSLPPYQLLSAIIDNHKFDLQTYTALQLEYVDDHRSRIGVFTPNNPGVPVNHYFGSRDYIIRILDYVVIDTGDPNNEVECRFIDEADASEFYEFIKPRQYFTEESNYPVNWVMQYDCIREQCKKGRCNRSSCAGDWHSVLNEGTIFVETIPSPDENTAPRKRFVGRKSDGTAVMILSPTSFNATTVRTGGNLMLGVKIRYLLFKILISFGNVGYADAFYIYVTGYRDIDSAIPLNIPELWEQFLKPYEY